jgi:phosphate transport system substrate-binding protein
VLVSLPRRALLIAAFTTLVGCSARALPVTAPGTPENPLRIMATTSALPLVMEAASAYHDPGLTLVVRSGNYRQALDALRRGEADLIFTTHLDSADAGTLWAAPVAQDAIALVVHLDNPVKSLTLTQILQAFQGRIATWSDLGGDAVPLVVVSRETGSGIRAEFEQAVMGRRQTTGAALNASSSRGVLHAVAENPGALGYVSLAAVDNTVRALAVNGVLPTMESISDNTYPLRSTVFVAGTVPPVGPPLAFIGWMQSLEGQAAFGRLYQPVLATPEAE